jgi:hypothetical protein
MKDTWRFLPAAASLEGHGPTDVKMEETREGEFGCAWRNASEQRQKLSS